MKKNIFLISLFVFLFFNSAYSLSVKELSNSKEWKNFKESYGEKWNAKWNTITSAPESIYGFNHDLKTEIDKDNIEKLTKEFLSSNKELFKVEVNNLKTKRIEIGNEISNITFEQTYNEIPVFSAFVNIGIKNNKIVYIKNHYYPDIKINISPVITEEKAFNLIKNKDKFFVDPIKEEYAKELIESIKLIDKPEKTSLVIFPETIGREIKYRLAWRVQLPLVQEPLSAWVYFIDAHNGELIYKFNDVIYESVSGTVVGPHYPKYPTEEQIESPFKNGEVTVYQDPYINDQTILTDENGNYYVEGYNGNVNIISNLEGLYVRVDDYAEETEVYHIAEGIPVPAVHNWSWSEDDTSYKQEASNVYYHVNFIHDFFTRGTPFDINEMNYQMSATINIDYICNAFMSDGNIFFFRAGCSGDFCCEATSLGTDIIYHEYTHAVTRGIYPEGSLPYSGQTGAMNEAYSDYFAASILNKSTIGENIFPEPIRNLDNNNSYPDDFVYQVHHDSMILSGALWDLKESLGKELTDALVINSMKLTPTSFFEFLDAILTADDDDQDLTNGTPHVTEICDAFVLNHKIYSPFCAGFTSKPIALIIVPELYKEIIYPYGANDYFERNVLFEENEVLGYALPSQGSNLIEYILEFGEGKEPESWNEIIRSSNPVDNDLLGLLTLNLMEQGEYTLRLSVTDSTNQTSKHTRAFIKGTKLQEGWPQETQQRIQGNPAIGDIDGDGFDEIAIVSRDMNLYVWNHNGSNLPGFPIKITDSHNKLNLDTTPTLVDLDLDGKLEILVKVLDFNIYAFDYQGEKVSNWPVTTINDGLAGNPVAANLDADPYPEIVIGGSDYGKVYIFNHDGTPLRGWPKDTNVGIEHPNPQILNTVAIGDLEGDNELEIVATVSFWNQEHMIYAWDINGEILPGMPYYCPYAYGCIIGGFYGSPSLADLDHDGDLEIIQTTFTGGPAIAVHHNGEEVEGWPVFTGLLDWVFAGASPGNLFDDSDLEVAFGVKTWYIEDDPMSHAGTNVVNWIAKKLFGWPKDTYYTTYVNPTIADIDNDKEIEIMQFGGHDPAIKIWDYRLYAWNPDGSVPEGWPKYVFGGGHSMPTIGDIDKDKDIEIIFGSQNGKVYVIDLPYPYNPSKIETGMFQQNPQHTGVYVNPPSLIFNYKNSPLTEGVYLNLKLLKSDASLDYFTCFDVLNMSTSIELEEQQIIWAGFGLDVNDTGQAMGMIVDSAQGNEFLDFIAGEANPLGIMLYSPPGSYFPKQTLTIETDAGIIEINLPRVVFDVNEDEYALFYVSSDGSVYWANSRHRPQEVPDLSPQESFNYKHLAETPNWVEQTIVNGETVSIEGFDYLPLNSFWNNANVSATSIGKYRAYAELTDSKGNILSNYDGKKLVSYHEFTVN
jgi:Zn-dependent metalloprotease